MSVRNEKISSGMDVIAVDSRRRVESEVRFMNDIGRDPA
jgi:hypothetical protein